MIEVERLRVRVETALETTHPSVQVDEIVRAAVEELLLNPGMAMATELRDGLDRR